MLVHGGPSTGPRTPAGLERSRNARLKHGYYARAAIAERAEARAMTRALRDYMAAVVPPEARRPARVLHGDLLLAFAAVTVERLGKPRERSRRPDKPSRSPNVGRVLARDRKCAGRALTGARRSVLHCRDCRRPVKALPAVRENAPDYFQLAGGGWLKNPIRSSRPCGALARVRRSSFKPIFYVREDCAHGSA